MASFSCLITLLTGFINKYALTILIRTHKRARSIRFLPYQRITHSKQFYNMNMSSSMAITKKYENFQQVSTYTLHLSTKSTNKICFALRSASRQENTSKIARRQQMYSSTPMFYTELKNTEILL